MASQSETVSARRPMYLPVDTLPDEKKAHRRFWDRERQREHRAKSRHRVAQLEAETQRLAEQLRAAEQERDTAQQALADKDKRIAELEATVQRQTTALHSILTVAHDATQEKPVDAETILAVATTTPPLTAQTQTTNGPQTPPPLLLPALPLDTFLQLGPGATIDSLTWAEFADAWPVTLVDDLPWPDEVVLDLPRSDGAAVDLDVVTPPWASLPLNDPPMCPLDSVFCNLQQKFHEAEQRAQVAATQPQRSCDDEETGSSGLQNTRYLAELSTSTFPQVSSLLNPIAEEDRLEDKQHRRATSQQRGRRPHRGVAHTVFARVMTQMPVQDTTARLAAMWVVCHLVRWRLCRSQPSFAALPPFLHPTAAQRTIAHPIWIDTIVWPAARDRLIAQRHIYSDTTMFDVFRTGLGQALSVSWPHSLTESLMVVPQDGTSGRTPDYCLSRAFQSHLFDLSNWMLDEAFVDEYPFLRGAVNERKTKRTESICKNK